MISFKNLPIIIFGIVVSFTIGGCEETESASQNYVKPMNQSYIDACTPEPLKISKIGWQAFLEQWNEHYLYFYTDIFHQFGWEPQYYAWMTLEKLQADFLKYNTDLSYLSIFNPKVISNDISNWQAVRDYIHSGSENYGYAEYHERDAKRDVENDYVVRVKGRRYQSAIDTIAANQKIYFPPFLRDINSVAQQRLSNRPDLSLYRPDLSIYHNHGTPEQQEAAAQRVAQEVTALVKQHMDDAKLPDSYLEFLNTSNGLITTSVFLGIRKEPDPYDFGLFSIVQIGYLINSYAGWGLWEFKDEESIKEVSIPTSIIFGGGEPDTTFVFDFSKPTGSGEYKIYALAGESGGVEILASWNSFPEFMEDNYQKSIATICTELKELEQAREDGRWKPIEVR